MMAIRLQRQLEVIHPMAMVCMIWRETLGSGALIGMLITRIRMREIPRDQIQELIAFCAEVHGITLPNTSVLRIATLASHRRGFPTLVFDV